MLHHETIPPNQSRVTEERAGLESRLSFHELYNVPENLVMVLSI